LGLVGESGCGKSTVGKTVLKLIEPTLGPDPARRRGTSRTCLPGRMWHHRRRIQTVFQDPYSSMNPRLKVGTIVGEPLENFGIASGKEKDERVAQLLQRVGMRARRDGPLHPRILRRPSASGWASPRRWRSILT